MDVQSLIVLLLLIKPLAEEEGGGGGGGGGGRGSPVHTIPHAVHWASLTLSVSLFLLAILEMDWPTFFTRRMNPAPLKAVVSVAFGS